MKVHDGIVGGKSLGPGTAYLCGFIKGPIKIGVTTRRPSKRLGAARREIGRQGVQLYGSWFHPQAYLIEKFAHMYLRNYDLGGEWFSVSVVNAYEAIEDVLDMLESPREFTNGSGNWFQRLGITEKSVRRCFRKAGEKVLLECKPRQRYRGNLDGRI
jgi:T5orf172 domain